MKRAGVVIAPVRATPNPSAPGAVFLTFTQPCPHCGRFHVHGSPRPETMESGSWGTRVPHCGPHTHELTPSGRRRSIYGRDAKPCENNHPPFLLVADEEDDDDGRR